MDVLADISGEHAELLPLRDTLALNINVAPIVAINMAFAINAATIGSNATAIALQGIGLSF